MVYRFIIIAITATCLHTGLQVRGAGNPYTPIVDRDVFGLRLVPTNNPPPVDPPLPLPKITPTGIMHIFGRLQALFKVTPVPASGQPAKDESYVMGIGERQDDIEVQKIDEPSAIITFNNHGKIQALSLTAAGITGSTQGRRHSSSVGISKPVSSSFGGHGRSLMPSAGNNASTPSPTTGMPDVETGRNTPQPAISQEEQILKIEGQRINWIKQGNPAAMILPPTIATDQVLEEK